MQTNRAQAKYRFQSRGNFFAVAVAAVLAMTTLAGCHMSTGGLNQAGRRNYQTGNYQAAIQKFQKVLAKDPNNANAYYNLAATYYQIGKKQNAPNFLQQSESLYHQCLDLTPDHTDCHRGLAALLVDTNRPQAAFTLLKRWAARSPEIPEPRIELARLYEEFGDNEIATRHLTDALHINPSSSRAWAAVGRLRERDGNLAQALSNYQQAFNLNRQQPGIASRIASLQQSISTGGGLSPNGTKMVNSPSSTSR